MLLPHVGHQKYQFLLQSAVLSSFYSPAVIVVDIIVSASIA